MERSQVNSEVPRVATESERVRDAASPRNSVGCHAEALAGDSVAAILDVLRNGERFLVCSHSRPDGDAVGSMLAMGMLLEQMGKRADLVTADGVPAIYRGLPGAESIRHAFARAWAL